jgi:hypothetical protein
MKDWRWFDSFKSDLEEQASKDVERHGRQSWGKKTTDFDDSASITRHRGKGERDSRREPKGRPGSGGQQEANQWGDSDWNNARLDYLNRNQYLLSPRERAELAELQRDADAARQARADAMRQAKEARRTEGRRFARELRREARARDRDERREGMRQAQDDLRQGKPPPGYTSW